MIKELFGEFFGYNKQLLVLNQMVNKLSKDVLYWHEQQEKTQKALETAENDYFSLKSEFDAFSKPISVPTAGITHNRQFLLSKGVHENVQIDIRNFIVPDFNMENELKKKNLIYDGTQDLDELIPAVYHLAKTGYKYGADSLYGFSEYWMFPFELKAALEHGNAGDCDDWSNLIGSYFAAANVPRTNWLIACGLARAGYGHSTVYAKDFTGVWRHLNSTKPEYSSKHLSGFPSSKDSGDKIGIKNDGYWYSYNDRFSFHRFDSMEAESSFNDSKKNISIKASK